MIVISGEVQSLPIPTEMKWIELHFITILVALCSKCPTTAPNGFINILNSIRDRIDSFSGPYNSKGTGPNNNLLVLLFGDIPAARNRTTVI